MPRYNFTESYGFSQRPEAPRGQGPQPHADPDGDGGGVGGGGGGAHLQGTQSPVAPPNPPPDGDPSERDAHHEGGAGDSLPAPSSRVHLPWRRPTRHASRQVGSEDAVHLMSSRDADMVVPAAGLRGCVLTLSLGDREVPG